MNRTWLRPQGKHGYESQSLKLCCVAELDQVHENTPTPAPGPGKLEGGTHSVLPSVVARHFPCLHINPHDYIMTC